MRSCAAAVLISILCAPGLCAGIIHGTITGQVISAGSAVPGVVVGNPVTGSYMYDASLTVNSEVGLVNPLTAFELTIGSNPKTFGLADLENVGLVVPGRSINSTPSADSLYFLIDTTSLSDFAGAFVPAQSLFPAPPQTFEAQSELNHSFAIRFTATPAAAVPEPPSLALLATAVAGFWSIVQIRRCSGHKRTFAELGHCMR